MIRNVLRKLGGAAFVLALPLAFTLTGCPDNDSTFEEAGEDVDEFGEDTQETFEDAGEETEDAFEEGVDETEDAFEQ